MATTQHTFCRICEAHCPLLADIDEHGYIVKLRPDDGHAIAKGFACHKGLSFLQVHNDPDRLNTPLRRTNARTSMPGAFETVAWDDTLVEIGTRIQALQAQYGPDSVAVYLGNPVGFNCRALPLAASFARIFGSRHAFSANTQDLANKYAASQHVFGSHAFTVPDLEHTDFFVCFGGNPKVSKGAVLALLRPMETLKTIRERGGDILFVNPRRIESSNADTGDVLLIKPDSDVYLMAALLHELDQLDAFDHNVIAARGKNIEQLRRFIAPYSPTAVARVVGIDAADIIALAEKIACKKSVAFYMGTGVNQGRQGTLAYWLLNMLTFVTGNLAQRGGSYRPIGNRGKQVLPEPPIDTVLGAVQPAWGCLPGNLLADLIEHESRPIRALINISGNPLLTMCGEDRLRHAFEKLDLIVSIDIYRSDTGEISDYILPATDWLEREDINFLALGLQQQPFVQYAPAVTPQKGERRNDWWILSSLAHAASKSAAPNGEGWGFIEKILGGMQLSLAALRDADGHTIYLPDDGDPAASYDDIVRHDDGRVDCCPAAFIDALARCEVIFQELASTDTSALQLISLRTNYMHNSWLANMPQLRKGRHALNPLHIHPRDAQQRGLRDGERVTVCSVSGEIETELLFDTNLREGVVAMSHGYGQRFAPALSLASTLPGANPNRLLPSGAGSYEKLSGMSWMNGVRVEVKAATV